MLVRVSKLLVALTLCLTIGLHWSALQSVAWVTMALKFSRTATLTEALARTFDGNHPCNLCLLVAEGKKAERKQEAQTPTIKFELFLVLSPISLHPPRADALAAVADVLPATSGEPPPPPPPRQT